MEGAHSLSETDCIHFPLFLPLRAFRRCDSVITTTCWAVWIGFTLILGVVLAAVTKHFFILPVSLQMNIVFLAGDVDSHHHAQPTVQGNFLGHAARCLDDDLRSEENRVDKRISSLTLVPSSA